MEYNEFGLRVEYLEYTVKKGDSLYNIAKKYNPGTMIFSSGHVMLYIGENANGSSYILHNTTSGNGECILQALSSYGGSRIIGLLKLQ